MRKDYIRALAGIMLGLGQAVGYGMIIHRVMHGELCCIAPSTYIQSHALYIM